MVIGMFASAPVLAADPVPPRTEAGQTLVVPQEHLDLGEVYYLTPGEDTQLLCISDAPLQRLVATCNRVVGYLVTPFDLEEAEAPLLAGAFRVPAAAFKTRLKELDGLLRSPPMLDAAGHPEVTFRVTRVSEVRLVSQERGRRSYTLNVAGELTVKDKALDLEVPARLEVIPFTWQTMQRNVGELLALRARLDLKLADLGVQKPGPTYKDRLADTIHVDVCLFGNTMSPEKNLDPSIKHEHYRRQLRFLTLVRDFDDPERGYDYGRAYLREIWDDAQALGRLARAVLTEDGVETRDLAFALKAARRADELTEHKDPTLLYLLAQVYYQKADLPAALDCIRRAADQTKQADPELEAEIQAALQRYEAQAGKTGE
jgi:polyisoprenoid-binding protein YceI